MAFRIAPRTTVYRKNRANWIHPGDPKRGPNGKRFEIHYMEGRNRIRLIWAGPFFVLQTGLERSK